jgi:hypothetical protein
MRNIHTYLDTHMHMHFHVQQIMKQKNYMQYVLFHIKRTINPQSRYISV